MTDNDTTSGNPWDRTTLFLEICGCGNRCKHCYIPEHQNRFKPFKRATEILDRFAELLMPPAVTKKAQLYFHDDPTLYPRIIELLDYARSIELSICPTLSTNGMGLARRPDGREVLQAFIGSGIKGLQLSLYGNREHHDSFTGSIGSYDDRSTAARMASDAGLWVHWSLKLTRDNPSQLIALSHDMNTMSITISPPSFSARWFGNPKFHPTMAEYDLVCRECPESLPGAKYQNCASMYTVMSELCWIELCRRNDDMRKYMEYGEEYPGEECKLMWLMEIDSDLYDSEECLPEYRVGNALVDSLRDIYGEARHTAAYGLLENAESHWLADKGGDPNGTFIGTLASMRQLWMSRYLHRQRQTA